MAMEGNGRGEEVEQLGIEENTVAEIYKYGGAFLLVGLEFFYKTEDGSPEMRIQLDGLQRDGGTYRATDVRADKRLEDSFHLKELTVGLGTRGRRDPVIMLMKSLKMPVDAYLDPLLDGPSSGLGEFQTPESQVRPHAEMRRPSAPFQTGEQFRGAQKGMQQGFRGQGRSPAPFQRAPSLPQMPRYNPHFGQPFAQQYQPAFRPAPMGGYYPYMHVEARMASPFLLRLCLVKSNRTLDSYS
jgi:hypothetical protein